jgi:hypothetical protein
LVVGCWLLIVGCWLLVIGYWLLVIGISILASNRLNSISSSLFVGSIFSETVSAVVGVSFLELFFLLALRSFLLAILCPV